MEKNNLNQIAKKKPRDWHKFSKTGILIGKLLTLVFILCLLVVFTKEFTPTPYCYFLIGIEITFTAMLCFGTIRMSTLKPKENLESPEHFNTASQQSILLWKNITHDISRYEEGTSYYFNSLRYYKYATIILAGLSTIILGLDLEEVKIGFMNYATFSKNIALVIGAVITVYTSLMVYWNIEKYWLINKTIVNKLRALRDDIEYLQTSGSLDEKQIIEKIAEYKLIKETFNKYWEGALSERNSRK